MIINNMYDYELQKITQGLLENGEIVSYSSLIFIYTEFYTNNLFM